MRAAVPHPLIRLQALHPQQNTSRAGPIFFHNQDVTSNLALDF
jgi:hypothetical protein